MFDVLLSILLGAHLICVNIASAGPLIAVWLERPSAFGDRLADTVAKRVLWYAVVLLLVGGLLGLVIGFLLWSPQYAETLARFHSRVYFGVWELVFSLVLMLLHACWWTRSPQQRTWQRCLRSLLPLLSATNLLYHFPPLFVMIADAVRNEAGVTDPITSAEFRQRLASGHVLPVTLHFVLASVAMVGILLIWFAWRRGDAQPDTGRLAKWGARVALVPSLLQVPAGIWLAMTLPATTQQRLFGGDIVGTSALCLSLMLVFALLHSLASVAMGETSRPNQLRCLTLAVCVVVLMTYTLQRTTSPRDATTRSPFTPELVSHDC